MFEYHVEIFDPQVQQHVSKFTGTWQNHALSLKTALKSRLLEVHVPLSYCVHLEDVGRWKHLGARNIEQQNSYNRAFRDFLNQRGFECLHVTPELSRAAGTGQRQCYWLNVHWTPAGDEIAVKAVADNLLGNSHAITYEQVRPAFDAAPLR